MLKKMRKIVKKMRKTKNMKKEERWNKDEKEEIAEMMMYDMMMTR